MWRKQILIIIEGNVKCKQNIMDSHIYHND